MKRTRSPFPWGEEAYAWALVRRSVYANVCAASFRPFPDRQRSGLLLPNLLRPALFFCLIAARPRTAVEDAIVAVSTVSPALRGIVFDTARKLPRATPSRNSIDNHGLRTDERTGVVRFPLNPPEGLAEAKRSGCVVVSRLGFHSKRKRFVEID